MSKRYNQKQDKKVSKWWIALIVIVAILAIFFGGIAYLFTHYYGMTRYEGSGTTGAGDAVTIENPEAVESMVDETGLTDSEMTALQEENQQIQNAVTLPSNEAVYNLLLVGVDRRDASWNGNSDSMILLSINKETKKIHMISFMRDLYADIPGHGVRKLNAASAYGGCQLLVETIEKNYGVNIDNYAWVDFNSMISIVDAIGGVELTLSEEEANIANNYITEMCNLQQVDPAAHLLASGGTYVCDGYQAVAYGRIRYVGNSDYQRTERQRTVLTKIMEKAQGMSLAELNGFATQVLPLVHHDISSGDMVSLLASTPSVLKYELQKGRVPYDGLYTVKGELLIPDMQATISQLQQDLYQ